MAGFIRRYGFFPGTEVITQIEGVVIVDLAPPGAIGGVGQGTTGMNGEFANMQYAAEADSSGVARKKLQPVEVFSAQDMLDKVGGWDETLGKFGADMGNGFVEIRNKSFSRLILQPVDLVTTSGGLQGTLRTSRDLPTNNSATDPTPIVPVSGASVPAGYEYKSGNNRVRSASTVIFLDDPAYTSGVDGSVTAAGAAVSQNFDAAGGDFINQGVVEGDILVLGVIGGAGALGANAYTLRVQSVTDADTLVVEQMDGSSWNWTTGSSLPWRLHLGRTADSGPNNQFSEGAGYTVLARPLDATLAAGTVVTPTVAPPAGTASTWDPLSGLGAAVHPSVGIVYEAALHAPNAATNATIEARYQEAIDAFMDDAYPARDVKILVEARKSNTIRNKQKTHVLAASSRGLTRRTIMSPAVNQHTLATVLGDSAPGVGANRDERVDYCWPGIRTSIPEAVGFEIATSDSKTTTDGILDVTSDTWLAAVESNLAPERNPGQAGPPVPQVLAPMLAFARGTPKLAMPEYIQLRAKGIAAPRFDRTVGPIFQSGVTTSLISGQKNISRRRMADFIQDSIADRLVQFSKLPLSNQLKDSTFAEVDAFMNTLLSPNNPAAQRIKAYSIDDKSGNTPSTEAQGIFVIIVKCQLIPSADFIVLQTDIGEGVLIVSAL